jgi:uncharacterized protein YjiS (DUF1127 family)
MSTIDTIRRDVFSSGPSAAAGFSPRLPRLGWLIVKMLDGLEAMAQKHRSRRLLLELTDEQLKDIGISRADAEREAGRPFWA